MKYTVEVTGPRGDQLWIDVIANSDELAIQQAECKLDDDDIEELGEGEYTYSVAKLQPGMITYELDYNARVTYKVDAESISDAIAECECMINGSSKSFTMNVADTPYNIEAFIDGRWQKCNYRPIG